jgi:hypothetical protein
MMAVAWNAQCLLSIAFKLAQLLYVNRPGILPTIVSQSETTNVPRPTSARTNLRLPKRSNAELIVVALTLIRSESRRTVGRRSPGLISPASIARSKKAASCS